jgi:hypothetical protein
MENIFHKNWESGGGIYALAAVPALAARATVSTAGRHFLERNKEWKRFYWELISLHTTLG